jgi:hypothetical protein
MFSRPVATLSLNSAADTDSVSEIPLPDGPVKQHQAFDFE